MRRLFPDTLLTRSIVMVVAALILAQIVAIVSFKLIAENMFAAMQRAAQIDVSMQVLSLAGNSEGLEDFSERATELDGVIFVRSDDQANIETDSDLGKKVRRKWTERGQAMGPVTDFRIGTAGTTPRPGRPPADPDRGPPPDGFPDRGPGQPVASRPDFGPRPDEDGPVLRRSRGFGGERVFSSSLAEMSIGFGEERWANVLISGDLRDAPPIQPFIFVLSLSLLAVAIAAAFAARWIYKPLNQLAEASAALGRGEKHSPLPVSGPRDLRNVMQAFNSMATQMETTLQSQKNVLVAIGHDLRTPLTALRIRTAMIEDASERDKMERALDQLQSLTEAALLAGTHSLRTGAKEVVELGALIQSLSDDLKDIGLPVVCEETPEQLLIQGWPDDLTRALRNIIENAVRYGERARIRLIGRDEMCRIEIDDDGPGIAEENKETVFEPLVRLEKSRNSETGGHGLGLHISRNILAAHGGSIALENREGGGLRVTVSLPRRSV